jgi:hypothetical protein
VPGHAVVLLRSLTVMARHQGPTTFFDFANEGAGIMRNTPLRFPSMAQHSLSWFSPGSSSDKTVCVPCFLSVQRAGMLHV